MVNPGYRQTPLGESFYFRVEDEHELHVEICGNPNGIPVVFLHGGPGSSINEKCRWFFNPEKYRIVLFDQRGTGKSKPFLSLKNNTPFAAIEDVEALRKHLGIEKWIVFGGSYGTTLGLLYGILHPGRVLHLVLRGIFLARSEDVSWLFQSGAGNFYPHEFEIFKNFIQPQKREALVDAYYELMIGADREISTAACKHWSDWENGLLRIKDNTLSAEIQPGDLSGALLEAHYFINGMFWDDDNYLLNHAGRLEDIPMDIYHGRFDIDCRAVGAFQLKRSCPHANLQIVQEASHYPYDPPLFDLLTEKMDELADRFGSAH